MSRVVSAAILGFFAGSLLTLAWTLAWFVGQPFLGIAGLLSFAGIVLVVVMVE